MSAISSTPADRTPDPTPQPRDHESPNAVAPDSLDQALAALSEVERLLVGLDFDGVLAPLVDDPSQSRPAPGAVAAVARLVATPGTAVALVSGRDLQTLTALSGISDPVLLIGSHGAERSDRPDGLQLDAAATELLRNVRAELAELMARHPQARVEDKPAGVVLHTRGLTGAAADAALRDTDDLVGRHPGLQVTPGKNVLELSVVHTGKGPALSELAEQVGAQAVLYLGDDVTDERAFVHLHGGSVRAVTVKVGDGETEAQFRLPDEAAVVDLVQRLGDLRSASGAPGL